MITYIVLYLYRPYVISCLMVVHVHNCAMYAFSSLDRHESFRSSSHDHTTHVIFKNGAFIFR